LTRFTKSFALALSLTAAVMGGALAQTAPANDEATLQAYIEQGLVVYTDNCAVCHGAEGEGGVGPALAKNGFVNGRAAVINQILYGATDHGMPPFAPVLSDEEVAQVSTYIRNAFGNSAGLVLPRSVELRRTAE